jgi:microcystin-dependent protein
MAAVTYHRQHNNSVPPGVLTSGISAVATTIPVTGLGSWPDLPDREMVVSIGYGTAGEELVTIRGHDGTNLENATRGVDGTSAATHSTGESVRHVWSAAMADLLIPPGCLQAFAGPTSLKPAGWLLANGESLLRADYPDLFIALGGASSPWGLPDGTHFNLPDLCSADNSAGAGRVGTGRFPIGRRASGATAGAVGDAGGQMDHDHTVSATGSASVTRATGAALTVQYDHVHAVSNANPPYAAILWLIKV